MGLLRFPGGSFPKEGVTGDPVLDHYLMDLDAKLLGSAKLRLLTLAEVKDNLLERKEQARKTAASDAEASQAAIREMGPVESFADEQRAQLKQRFVKTAILFGLPTGLWGVVVNANLLNSLSEGHRQGPPLWWRLLELIIGGVFSAVIGGSMFAWWMVYLHPTRRLPEKGATGSEYLVAYSKNNRVLGRIGRIFFAAMAFAFIAGRTIPQVDTLVRFMPLPQWMILLLGVMALFNFYFASLALRTYRVEKEGFWIEGRLKRERVLWSNIKAVKTLGDRRPWLPANWKRVKSIEYVKADGRQKRVLLYPDMINADRFLISIRERLVGEPRCRVAGGRDSVSSAGTPRTEKDRA